jgi:hypothetical protein
MNGPDSISDPVARRLYCTESYSLARGSARLQLGSAQLGAMALGSRLVTWQVGPTVMTCLMTGRWRVADWTLTCLLTGRWHACWLCILASWCRHPYPGLARGSSRLVFGSGQLIRVKKMRVTRGARLCAWAVSSPARDGAGGGFWRPISTRFSTVASSLPPLHSGMVKTQFWQLSFLSKIKHSFKPCALIPIVGNSTGDVLILAQRRVKHTDTIFNVVRQNRLHPRESQYY